MGIAEVIPGVSGGTIAFITGIYEQLIESIKAFHPRLIKLGLSGKWTSVLEQINGRFLFFLLLGMAGGILIGIIAITHLIETKPEMLWAFFFGLILASAVYVGRQLTHWAMSEYIILLLGIILAWTITILNPAEGSTSPLMVFISGFIAISAMILPGVSGSFMLLLMGMYTIIIPTVKSAFSTFESSALITVSIFGLGCLCGLASFSRVLSWTFKNFKNPTLALLTGFMIGSLNKIWPWRNPVAWIEKSTGEVLHYENNPGGIPEDPSLYRLLKEQNVLPNQYNGDPDLVIVLLSFLLGIMLVFLISRNSKPI